MLTIQEQLYVCIVIGFHQSYTKANLDYEINQKHQEIKKIAKDGEPIDVEVLYNLF